VKKIDQINVMGPFETKGPDAEPVEFRHRKVRALLAYLAVERARPLARERLATLLWSRTGDERARHNLRQALSRIRGYCPDLIDTTGDGVTLDPAACTVDVIAFTELAKSVDARDLQLALELYRGDLLADYNASEAEYQDWLQLARARLRQKACDVADRLSTLLRDEGREHEAIDILERLLWIDPANESAHRDLMALFAQLGRRSQALRQYQDCAAALKRELDAEPGPETQRLLAEIRQAEPASSAVDAAALPMPEAAVNGSDEHERLLPRRLAAILYADVAR
jgi:DNA-binding SARP family transcriptional activator